MSNQNIVRLSQKLIIREENSDVLLFNKKNGAVISLHRKLFYDIHQNGISPSSKSSTELINILQKNLMLEYPTSINVLMSDSGDHLSKYPSLFQLHSENNPFIVLWAITSRCNFRCVYCFPDVQSLQNTVAPLTLSEMHNIKQQIIDAKVFQLTFTGGEALLNKNIWEVVPDLYQAGIRLILLSNGTSFGVDTISKIKKFDIVVGISLDGPNEEINAITRGAGWFEKTIHGINKLTFEKVPVAVLVTLTRFNFPVLEQCITFISNLGIKAITIQDLRPFGNKHNYNSMRLTIEQEKSLRPLINKIKIEHPDIDFNLTELFIFPAKNITKTKNNKIMQCPAGSCIAYIDFYGDLYPCTSLPTFKLGNILKNNNITNLWQHSAAIKELRSIKNQTMDCLTGCNACSSQKYCFGGCRGDALFYNNDVYGFASRCPKFMEIEHSAS